MNKFQFIFSGRDSVWMPLIIVLLCALLSWGLYVYFKRNISARIGRKLVLFRILSFLLLSVLFLSPVIRYERLSPADKTNILLVDRSESMGVKDVHTRSRLAAVRSRLEQEGYIANMQGLGPVQAYYFGESIEPYTAGGFMRARGSTHIAGALQEIVRRGKPDTINAVVVFSDGGETGSETVPQVITSIPVYTVGVGSEVSPHPHIKDVSIQIRGPLYRKCYVDEECSVPFIIEEKTGYSGIIQVSFKGAERFLAQKKVQVVNGFAKDTISCTPKKPGALLCELIAQALDSETVLLNNRAVCYADVYDKRIRVLYTEGSVKPEYKFLKRFLLSRSDMEAACILQTATGMFLHQGEGTDEEFSFRDFPQQALLKGYDVFIAGDVLLSEKGAQNIIRFAEEGGGIILAAPLKMAQARYDVSRLLPSVDVSVRYTGKDGRSALAFTDAGLRSKLWGDPGQLITEHAFIKGIMNFSRIPQGFRPLIVAEPGRTPFLLYARLGKGSLYITGSDTTYLWYMAGGSRGMDAHASFWNGLIRGAAGSDIVKGSEDTVEYRMEKRFFNRGEEIAVYARVPHSLEEKQPRMHISVPGQDIAAEFVKVTGSNREYRAVLSIDKRGEYKLRAGSGSNMQELHVIIKKGEEELKRLDPDPDYLRTISDMSGGFYVPLDEAEAVLSNVRHRRRSRAEIVEIPLWNSWIFFALICGLLGVEWFLRKRYDLY